MKFNSEASYRNPVEQREIPDGITDLKYEAGLDELAKQPDEETVSSGVDSVDAITTSGEDKIINMFQTEVTAPEAVTKETQHPPLREVVPKGNNTAVPEAETVPQEQKVPERESTMSAQELRNRYDGTYRHDAAEAAWKERGWQNEARTEVQEKYGAEAEAEEIEKIKGYGSPQGNEIKQIDSQLAYMEKQTRQSIESLDTRIEYKQMYVAMRKPIPKMVAFGQKFFSILGKDVEREEINQLQIEKQTLLAQEAQRNADLQLKKRELQLEIKNQNEADVSRIQKTYSLMREIEKKKSLEKRKYLLEKVHTENKNSRLASEQTAELLAEGKLSISELAKATNSLVVHALPLEGWSMRNTSMNNEEINTNDISVEEKIRIVNEKKPDLAVSVVSIDNPDVSHGTMYPFGLIVDGSLIASYDNDTSTITKGDARYRKYTRGSDGSTLQIDPVAAFEKNAQRAPNHGTYNEAIVHNPKVAGIFIDGERLKPVIDTESGKLLDSFGDTVEEYYLPGQEAEVLKQYQGLIDNLNRGLIESNMPRKKVIALSGPYAGQEVYRFKRTRRGEQKAIDFAQSNYPDLPIYIRRADGVYDYDMDGRPVSAEDIYANS